MKIILLERKTLAYHDCLCSAVWLPRTYAFACEKITLWMSKKLDMYVRVGWLFVKVYRQNINICDFS
jgi:hypothetical protein